MGLLKHFAIPKGMMMKVLGQYNGQADGCKELAKFGDKQAMAETRTTRVVAERKILIS
jgi:hypothetical protein